MEKTPEGVPFLQFGSNDLVKCKFREKGNTETPLLEQFEKPDLAVLFKKIKMDRAEKVEVKEEGK